MFHEIILIIFVFTKTVYLKQNSDHGKFYFLRNFTCAVVEDELIKRPELSTVAMIELKNKFPIDFSRDILKCLPDYVTKVIMQPDLFRNSSL